MPNAKSKAEESGWACAVKDILAGSCRGVAQVFVGHPLDTIKVRLQTQSRSTYSGFIDCSIKTIRHEGLRGLYKGATSPVSGAALYSAGLFLSYGQAKRLIQTSEQRAAGEPLNFQQQLMASAFTGFAASFVEGPMDLIKSKMQVQLKSTSSLPMYSGTFDCLKKVIQTRGVVGLYQGLGSVILRNVPGSMAYFTSYELIRQWLQTKTNHRSDSYWPVLLAGGIGGIIFWLSIYPFDVVKTHMQTDHVEKQHRTYRNAWHCMTQIYRTEGFGRLWRGFTPCLIRAAPTNAASFLAFEYTRQLIN